MPLGEPTCNIYAIRRTNYNVCNTPFEVKLENISENNCYINY